MSTVQGSGVCTGWTFSRSARSPKRARRLLVAQLAEWGVDGAVSATAELLLSELVTNAVRHAVRPAGRLVAVDVELAPGRLLRVEVADACEAPPVPRPADAPDAEGGRGLLLVEALSAHWGTYPRRHVGKVVWFVLDLAPAGAGALAAGAAQSPE
ncbi:ATP-binding protein [Streptomyces sp. NPDC020983]|uniref:ATP-binding protein n=1 Tax=Streptomyces sp. NPDC020983 TaxID=3365106 RepID=UPI00379528C4